MQALLPTCVCLRISVRVRVSVMVRVRGRVMARVLARVRARVSECSYNDDKILKVKHITKT